MNAAVPNPTSTDPATTTAQTTPATTTEATPLAQTPPAQPPETKPAETGAFKIEDLKLPDGFELKPEEGKAFAELVNKHSIPREAVDALVALHTAGLKATSEAGSVLWDKTQDEWRAEIQKDTEFGGPKWDETAAACDKVLEKYGSKELRDMLDMTGMGNRIEMVRFIMKLSKDLPASEPGHVQGTPGATPGLEQTLQKFYDNPTSRS